MKKYVCLILPLVLGFGVYAQCPVDVSITANSANPVCRNTSVQLTANPINGGANPQYFWILNGDTVGTSSTYNTTSDFENVTLVMVSSNGCPINADTTSYQVDNVTIVADYNVIVTECNQPTADVEILGITGSPVSNDPFTYSLGTDGGNIGQQDIYQDLPISSYPLYITDSQGCTDTTWINLTTIECPPPLPIEAITPNDDGSNDTWIIHNIQYYPNNEVFIFDRWGQRVYHKNEYDNTDGWQAKYLGINMPVSTYYYVLKIYNEKSDDIVMKGAISVFR